MGYRPLGWIDIRFCWDLFSDQTVRSASKHTEALSFWGHVRWMFRWIYASERDAYIMRWSLRSVGVIRASARENGGCDIGVAVIGTERGHGIARAALQRMTPIFVDRFDGPVYAHVKNDNERSIEAFLRAGYTPTVDDWPAGYMVLRHI